ncbi:MAG: Gfo/Idh/MocA family oxidoreductase [Saprospiraceae bacterium]
MTFFLIKYILLGTGNISRTYVNAIQQMPGSEIVGCISRTGNKPENLKNIPVWDSLGKVDLDFDAVIITTPNGKHCEGILQAAELGKHVLTEKPLGINLSEVDNAIQACKDKNLCLAVAYQRRTAPDNLAIKSLIDSGQLGRIFAVDLSCKFYRDQAYYDSAAYRGGFDIDGGGPFIQQASHNIDLYCWFFDRPTKVVSMMDTFVHKMEGEDHGAAILRHGDGMIGTIVASTATKPGFAARMEVHSTKGSFTLTDDVISNWEIEGVENPSDSGFRYQHAGATSSAVSDVSGHLKILKNFEKVISEGGELISDGESARLTSEVILEIYDSRV